MKSLTSIPFQIAWTSARDMISRCEKSSDEKPNISTIDFPLIIEVCTSLRFTLLMTSTGTVHFCTFETARDMLDLLKALEIIGFGYIRICEAAAKSTDLVLIFFVGVSYGDFLGGGGVKDFFQSHSKGICKHPNDCMNHPE